MPLSLDPEISGALASMGDVTPPRVGDIEGRRTFWEPVIGAASDAQPTPADVTMTDHMATAVDGAQIMARWYVKDGATPGPAVVFLRGAALLEQDYLRRRLLREHDSTHTNPVAPAFVTVTARTALDLGDHVIPEGFLHTESYADAPPPARFGQLTRR